MKFLPFHDHGVIYVVQLAVLYCAHACIRQCTIYIRPLQINSLFLITPGPKNWCGRAAGNGRLITSLMGNGRQNHKFSSPVLCCADGNISERKSRGDEKQLIDLEWPYIDTGTHMREISNVATPLGFNYGLALWIILPKSSLPKPDRQRRPARKALFASGINYGL